MIIDWIDTFDHDDWLQLGQFDHTSELFKCPENRIEDRLMGSFPLEVSSLSLTKFENHEEQLNIIKRD